MWRELRGKSISVDTDHSFINDCSFEDLVGAHLGDFLDGCQQN